MRMCSLLVVGLWLAAPAWAQGKQVPNVKAPNEGGSRVYTAPYDEVFAAATKAATDLKLELTLAPDGSVFIASPTAWTRPASGLTFQRTLVVRVRTLAARETEIVIEEEGRSKEAGAAERIAALHERIVEALGEVRSKKPLVPKHPSELQAEALVIKQADLPTLRPAADEDNLRAWNLGASRQASLNTAVWKLKGNLPLHFTPTSERRFMVMEGELRMSVGTRTFWLAAGDFVVVPKAVRMAIDVGEGRATLLVVESPPVDDAKTVWLEPRSP